VSERAKVRAAAPSLDGRLVEARAALEALEDALREAARSTRADALKAEDSEDSAPWVYYERAAGEVGGAQKSLMDARAYVQAARLRGAEV